MTSQDDIAALQAMRERGEITDDEYTVLRRYVLWGTPLPPEMRSRFPGPPGYVHRVEPARPGLWAPGAGHPVSQAGEPPTRVGGPSDRPDGDRWRPTGPAGTGRADRPDRPGEVARVERPARETHPDTGRQPVVPGRELARRAPAAPATRTRSRNLPERAAPAQTGSRVGTSAGRNQRPVAPGRRRRQWTALVSAVLVLGLVAAGVWWFALRVSPVQPDVYAHRVCTTVSGWQTAMAKAREQLVTTIASKDPPKAIRDKVVSFYQDAEERTAKLSVAMAGIGPPNVVGGADYAESLRQAVASTASSFHDDAVRAGQLDVSSRAIFISQAQSEAASIDSRSQPMFDALSGRGLEPPLDLRTAFDSDPTCAAYTG